MKYKALFLLPFVILGISMLVPVIFVKNRIDTSRSGTHFTQIVSSISANFTPVHSGTNIVVLHFKNPGLQNTDSFQLDISNSQGAILYSTSFSGRNTGDPSDLRFQFPPLAVREPLQLKITPTTPSQLEVYVDDANQLAFTTYFRR